MKIFSLPLFLYTHDPLEQFSLNSLRRLTQMRIVAFTACSPHVQIGLKTVTLWPNMTEHILSSGDSNKLGKALSNDLQAAACSLKPALRLILDVGLDYGALGGIVSGSGPSVAFLAEHEDHALDLVVALTSSGVVGNVVRASGPVPGARVIESL